MSPGARLIGAENAFGNAGGDAVHRGPRDGPGKNTNLLQVKHIAPTGMVRRGSGGNNFTKIPDINRSHFGGEF